MKKVGMLVLCAVAVVAVASWKAAPVQAFGEFKKEFDNKYVKDPADPAITPQEKALAEAAGAAKCGICHTGPEGKNKKVRNTYGAALQKLLTKADKKDVPKIQAALDTVAKESSDAADPKAPTFGDLIKDGKLPGKDPPPAAQ
jgi:hypothetical protein